MCIRDSHKTGETLAIKIIRNKEKFHRQAKIELNILKYVKDNDPDDASNMIMMRESFIFRGHMCITFELLSTNLYDFLKANRFRGLSLGLVRRIGIQILQALVFLKKHRIVHCDLKPENILLKSPDRSGVKVVDLGSSCFENEKLYTYIQSRYYRSPEVILGFSYDMAIDVWSFGCIMFELSTGFPLFPGESEKDQLQRIMEVLGRPDDHVINTSPRRANFFDENNQPILTQDRKGRMHYPGTKNLEELMQCEDPLFVDFVRRCLTWYPSRRLTPEQGLLHEWIVSGLPQHIRAHHLQSVKNASQTGFVTYDVSEEKKQRSFKVKNGGAKNGDQTISMYRYPAEVTKPTRNPSNERSLEKSLNRRENSRFIELSPQKSLKTITSPINSKMNGIRRAFELPAAEF
eukprot:TRINITY_DN1898_c0_g1_i1.p1 TRINITY_DN1898_c0_g1~~TRINITY_DN1898_c0_g1_i1.p1  ORF type:complete len:404 (-),score=59.67 TRINITY_DN1898_c0_g1_i1:58-1269(-)